MMMKTHRIAICALVATLASCGVSLAAPAYAEADTANETTAIAVLRESAEVGDITAQRKLGDAYLLGRGVEQDYEQAMRWYRKAADAGNAEAQYNVGRMYGLGWGAKRDIAKAVEWLEKAAKADYADAQLSVAVTYMASHEAGMHVEKATRWYREAKQSFQQAAEADEPQAQMSLGIIHLYTSTAEEAAHWFRKAAKAGNIRAQLMIGLAYFEGKGVEKNRKRAYYWLSLAATQSELSMRDSALNYFQWMQTAAARGQGFASTFRDSAAKQLEDEERFAVQDLATECFESDYHDCQEPTADSAIDEEDT